MKQHQIIELLHKVVAENQNFTTWTVSTPHLVALVTYAIEAEREWCAMICEDMERNGAWVTKEEAAAAIRARGEPTSRGEA